MSEKYELFRKFACNAYREKGCWGKGSDDEDDRWTLTKDKIKGLYLHGYKNIEGKRLVIKGRKAWVSVEVKGVWRSWGSDHKTQKRSKLGINDTKRD